MAQSLFSICFMPARFAYPVALPSAEDIPSAQRVAPFTMRLRALHGGCCLRTPATTHIDEMGDGLKVIRAHACAYPAEMVEFQTCTDQPYMQLVRKSMSQDGSSWSRETEDAVFGVRVCCRSPYPAGAEMRGVRGYGAVPDNLFPETQDRVTISGHREPILSGVTERAARTAPLPSILHQEQG